MLICELCGSANNELDDACRVCGLPLKTEAQASAPAPTNAAAQAATSSWPVPPHVVTPPAPVPAPQPSPLQMSAVKQAPQTGVPPMMSDRQEIAPVAAAPDSTSVPGFMQSARTAPPQPEPVSLISAND